jgi:sugar lactone lactonase YvrE
MAMRIVRRGCRRLAAAGLVALAAIIVLRGEDGSPIRALAPVEIVAAGFEALAGVAVDATGAVLVTDREAGTLTRIDTAGRRRVLLDGLHAPAGVAIDPTGGVLVIEQGGRRLLGLAADGLIAIVASPLRQARSVAVAPDGRIWVSMRRAVDRHDADDEDKDDGRGSEYVIARVDEAGVLTPFASGFVGVQGLAADGRAVYVVMARLATERGRLRTTLARIPVRVDGSVGPVEPLLHNSPYRLLGVTIDAAGDVFVSGSANDEDGDNERTGVILKRQADGRVSTFAAGLRDPVALAFAPNGDVVAVEKDEPGRVLRFLAPLPPSLAAPVFTNQAPLALDGRAAAGARVTVGRAEAPRSLLAFTVADAITGAFTLQVPLEPNATNGLSAVATGAGGAGLVSRPVTLTIVHDNVPPSLAILEPVSGVHTRGAISSTARAEDERSGVAALLWGVDGTSMAHLENQTPEEPLTAAATLATDSLAEGPHVIEVAAVDRAANRTVAVLPMVVDRTPPETVIVSGPAAEIAERTTTFTISGTDAWSALRHLDYAWRLDDGPWSAFDALAVITLSDLAPGGHRFEVKARDRAGNEDATPAVQTFTVRSLRIRILEPVSAAVVTTRSVWVRGVVEGGTGEVTASVVALPPEIFPGEATRGVEGGTFVIEVPADPALTRLTVVATDGAGATAQADVSIVVAGDATVEQPVDLWPPGGLAPLTVRIGLRGWKEAHVAIDIDADGTNEFEGRPAGNDRYVTYDRPGVYMPTVVVTTNEGIVQTRRGRVEVYDAAALDARLQAVWRGFKDALREGDVQTAVQFIAAERRQAWADYFESLPPDAFADVDLVFTTVTLVEVGYGGAQYEMLAERDGLFYSYAIWFQTDEDGRWRLWRF